MDNDTKLDQIYLDAALRFEAEHEGYSAQQFLEYMRDNSISNPHTAARLITKELPSDTQTEAVKTPEASETPVETRESVKMGDTKALFDRIDETLDEGEANEAVEDREPVNADNFHSKIDQILDR